MELDFTKLTCSLCGAPLEVREDVGDCPNKADFHHHVRCSTCSVPVMGPDWWACMQINIETQGNA